MGAADERTSRDDEGATDEELLARARAGDSQAFALLYARHDAAALRLARILAGDDAGELVSEAASRVLAQIRAGRGPVSDFRSYLHATIRNRHRDLVRSGQREEAASDRPWLLDDVEPGADELVDQLDGSAAAAALTSLPQTWQRVLWHLEVEGLKPAEVAALLDMSPAAVSSLAYRAREGLKQAYLVQQVPAQRTAAATAECAWVQQRLVRYVRGVQSAKHAGRIADHLPGCADCTAVHDELVSLNRRLAGAGWPLVLLGAVTVLEGHASVTLASSGAFVQELATRAGMAAGPAAAASGVTGLWRLVRRLRRGQEAGLPVGVAVAAAGLVLAAGAGVGAWALAASDGDHPSPDTTARHGRTPTPPAPRSTASAPAATASPSHEPRRPRVVTPSATAPTADAPATVAPTAVSTPDPVLSPKPPKPHLPRPPKSKPTPPPVALPVVVVPVMVVPLPPTAHPVAACDELGSLDIPQVAGLSYALVAGDGRQGLYTVSATPLPGYAVQPGAPTAFSGDLGPFHACTAAVAISVAPGGSLGHLLTIATTSDLRSPTVLTLRITFANTTQVTQVPGSGWQCRRTNGTELVPGTVYTGAGTVPCDHPYVPGDPLPSLQFDLGTGVGNQPPSGSVEVSAPARILGTFPY